MVVARRGSERFRKHRNVTTAVTPLRDLFVRRVSQGTWSVMVGWKCGLVQRCQLRIPVNEHDLVGVVPQSVFGNVASDHVLGNFLLRLGLAQTDAANDIGDRGCGSRRHRNVLGDGNIWIDDVGSQHGVH